MTDERSLARASGEPTDQLEERARLVLREAGDRAIGLNAFEAAVAVFGRGQVSTYILAGLGDTAQAIVDMARDLIARGVYPFVVPFVPISGTPLEDHPAPTPDFMRSVLAPIGAMLAQASMRSADIKAGCGKCGACSSLSSYEV